MRELGRRKDIKVIKPVGWRQTGFTIFLLLCGFFFVFIGSFKGILGVGVSWSVTVTLTFAGLLNLFDQIFEWSRLKIDGEGYHLRGWWRRQSFRHEEIEGFESEDYAKRKLIVLVLKPKAQAERGLEDPLVAFPCAFGRPVEEVIETLKSSLKKKKI
jgi:hypothetical protein